MTAVGYASTTGDTRKLTRAGDAMTGDLVLSDDSPDTAHSATSKAYVLAAVAGAGTGVASDTVVAETSFGQSAVAGASATYSRGDHTHGTPASPSAGSSIKTASARITDDNLGGLPSAAAWTIAQTSANTKLQRSIAAAAGDRIKVYGNFMRSGSHFLDWVLLDNTGAIALYAASGTSSPLAEGNPVLYPSLSFSYAPAAEMFTVAAGHISGGLITVALAHQGTGSGLVYAHTTYPFRLRLENIGAEPS
jgi:hypothetical protein